MTSPLRIALAGLGVHGMRYAEHLLAGEVPGAVLAACSRADRERGRAFAARHGLTFFADPLDLARASSVDAVVVVLRPDLHPPLVLACLEAERPVLVEKPMCPDVRSAALLVARAARRRSPVMVAHTLRFDATVERVRGLLPSLGTLRMLALNQRFEPSERGWIDEPGAGGSVLNTGVHGFDLLRHLSGAEVVSVQAETARIRTRATEDAYAAVLRLEPGGILATLDNTRTTAGRSGRIEIVGDLGQLRADHVHRTLHRIEGRTETDLGPVPPGATIVETLRAFVKCVVEGSAPPITAEDGLRAVEVAEAVLLSARLGRRVRIEEIRA